MLRRLPNSTAAVFFSLSLPLFFHLAHFSFTSLWYGNFWFALNSVFVFKMYLGLVAQKFNMEKHNNVQKGLLRINSHAN